jgi:hypothetical protein
MSDEAWREDAGKTARILQIIVSAMCVGVAAFLTVAIFVAPLRAQAAPLLPISLTLVTAILAVFGLAMPQAVILLITAKARREIGADGAESPLSRERRFLTVYQTRTIIGAAASEGWAFFAVIAYMIEGSPVSLGLAAFLLLTVAAYFPTSSRIISWVEREVETLEMARGMGER